MKKTISIVLVLVLCMAVEVGKADFTFGTPTNLGPTVNSSSRDLKPSVSADGLSLFFTSTRSGGLGGMDIWAATRETIDDPWGEPVNLGSPVNSSAWETGCISYNGLSLYISSTRSRGSNANADIWVTTRDTIHNEWGTPMNLGPMVNSAADQCYISISADELSLYFSSNRSGGYGAYDLWVTTRETTDEDWGAPVNLGSTVNSSGYDTDPSISADGLLLFFQSTRPGGLGGESDIWMTRRATINDEWGEPVNLGPIINSSASDDHPNVSADGSTLYFRHSQSGRHSGGDIWQAPIIPIVDFNGDGKVNVKDFSKLAQHWGQNQPSVDIGPMPWGDGRLDIHDVAVLGQYWLTYPGAVAHWKLDETEGFVVHDSVGDHDAFVLTENPLWRPTDGKIHGALELDGSDDFVSVPFVLDPADGPFSVFAWIQGGAPGQVIISQMDGTGTGATWLAADPLDGTLMSALVGTGRFGGPLVSDSVITDGRWHRIGLVWDGSHRTLYVDDTEAAKDTQPQGELISADGGLYFGPGKDPEVGSFLSGLIDDVKIYDRAIVP